MFRQQSALSPSLPMCGSSSICVVVGEVPNCLVEIVQYILVTKSDFCLWQSKCSNFCPLRADAEEAPRAHLRLSPAAASARRSLAATHANAAPVPRAATDVKTRRSPSSSSLFFGVAARLGTRDRPGLPEAPRRSRRESPKTSRGARGASRQIYCRVADCLVQRVGCRLVANCKFCRQAVCSGLPG